MGWPVYVDTDRSFEKNFGFTISLNNIYQVRIFNAQGEMEFGNPQKLAESVKQMQAGAKWNIEPTEIPDVLKKAWRAVEFGQFGAAAPLVKQALNASDAKVKAAAKKLEAAIQTVIAAHLSAANASAAAGQKWEAYKVYELVTLNFKDFAESRPAVAELSRLRSDSKVSKELQARTILEQVNTMRASPRKTEQAQAEQGVLLLTQKFADTEAGAAAKGK